eukprot:scaffold1431_cov346-Pavlova_lutheri.AAC.18
MQRKGLPTCPQSLPPKEVVFERMDAKDKDRNRTTWSLLYATSLYWEGENKSSTNFYRGDGRR